MHHRWHHTVDGTGEAAEPATVCMKYDYDAMEKLATPQLRDGTHGLYGRQPKDVP